MLLNTTQCCQKSISPNLQW